MDYDSYEFTKMEWCLYTIKGSFSIITVTYLMYRNIFVSLAFLPLLILYLQTVRKALIQKRKKQLILEFKEFLYSMIICLGSGYSIENSLPHIIKEMDVLYPEGGLMSVEIRLIHRRVALGETTSNAFKQFSDRAGCSAISLFTASLDIGIQQGGNLVEVLKENSNMIIDQVRTQQEIEVLIAEKQFELKFLSMFPFLVLALLNYTASTFMEVLYVTWLGRVGMTIAMMIIGLGIFISKKLVDQYV